MSDKKITQEEIVNHLKNYGFIFASSEIYGGLANSWDYGPLGALMKKNLKDLWWRKFITEDTNVVSLDSSIILNPKVWIASGHLSNFSDPLIDCRACKSRFRADQLIETNSDIKTDENTSTQQLKLIIDINKIKCPNCSKIDWTEIRKFNLMFKTYQGVLEDSVNTLYLRPETAQGIFINFHNVLRTMRLKLPFGIGQIGKAFRNEITPGNFIFRTREFEQMELEYFCQPTQADQTYELLLTKIQNFIFKNLQIKTENIQIKEHSKNELSHYSTRTSDFEYNFPHGWAELWGIANRTDFDLKSHQENSKQNLTYLDPVTNERITPFVIEPSVGVERLLYALFVDKYEVESLENGESRAILHLPYALAPYQVVILPLTNKLIDPAKNLFKTIAQLGISVSFDASGSIGKRYRRQDAIGTPYCLTFDFETEKSQKITIRERDSMKQETIGLADIKNYLDEKNRHTSE